MPADVKTPGLNEKQCQEFESLLRWFDKEGDKLKKISDLIDKYGVRAITEALGKFKAKITDVSYDGTNQIWKHAWSAVYPIKNGYAVSTGKAAASGTLTSQFAINDAGGPACPGTIVDLDYVSYFDTSTKQYAAQHRFAWAGTFLVKTTTSAAGIVDFGPYAATFLDGTGTLTIYNGFEPLDGSPGSLGVNVSAVDGTVNGGSCVVQRIGPNAILPVYWDSLNHKLRISAPNSAQ